MSFAPSRRAFGKKSTATTSECGCQIWSRANCAESLWTSRKARDFMREDWLQPVQGSAIGGVFKTGKSVVVDVTKEQMAPVATPLSGAEGRVYLNDGSGKASRSAFPLGVNGILSSISKWLGME